MLVGQEFTIDLPVNPIESGKLTLTCGWLALTIGILGDGCDLDVIHFAQSPIVDAALVTQVVAGVSYNHNRRDPKRRNDAEADDC